MTQTDLLAGTPIWKKINHLNVLTDSILGKVPRQGQACHLRGLNKNINKKQTNKNTLYLEVEQVWKRRFQKVRRGHLKPKVEMLCLYFKWHGKPAKDWMLIVGRQVLSNQLATQQGVQLMINGTTNLQNKKCSLKRYISADKWLSCFCRYIIHPITKVDGLYRVYPFLTPPVQWWDD